MTVARRYFVRFSIAVGVVFLLIVANLPWEESRGSARNSQCRYNLKAIGRALQQYHDEWGSFPPAYVNDEQGRRTYGWRTLLLPYLDQAAMYHFYRFDEPWNSAHNAKLCSEIRPRSMPFICPEQDGDQTTYLAVVGPKTAWPGTRPAKREVDFPDGLRSTILVVEVENSGVQWMEPRDLLFDEMSFEINGAAGNAISSRHKFGGFWPWSGPTSTVNVLFADGSISRLPADTAPDTIRAWITASGGDKAPRPP